MEDMDRLMPFRTVSERFKLIEDASRTVYVPWKDGAEVTDRLQKGERSRKLFREAGLYGVTVYENHFQDMDRSGALYILEQRCSDRPADLLGGNGPADNGGGRIGIDDLK